MPGNADNPFSFWQKLKRREVIRIITVYAAVAFVILELTDIVAPSLGLPGWTSRFRSVHRDRLLVQPVMIKILE